MNIFPAIDLYDGKAVRLYKGDYAQMTVYSENPIEIARDFESKGAKFIHMVDLEGAKDGTTPDRFDTDRSSARNRSFHRNRRRNPYNGDGGCIFRERC